MNTACDNNLKLKMCAQIINLLIELKVLSFDQFWPMTRPIPGKMANNANTNPLPLACLQSLILNVL